MRISNFHLQVTKEIIKRTEMSPLLPLYNPDLIISSNSKDDGDFVDDDDDDDDDDYGDKHGGCDGANFANDDDDNNRACKYFHYDKDIDNAVVDNRNSVSNTVGRLAAGFLSFLGQGTMRIYNCGTFLAGLSCLLLPLCTTFPALVAFAVAHGFFHWSVDPVPALA
ncbi:monocarboxylate transporter 14 [Plakobranchus ocellatus]|uniref:Monocarboxylate transporter 14 n=1 Tax=Plakobranchus ocellatus TaxID=259542 RepID=A0AAV3XXZ3_9GAST|nr:monocarboxylate transporter 14 [Plakobranchus ocellatus]